MKNKLNLTITVPTTEELNDSSITALDKESYLGSPENRYSTPLHSEWVNSGYLYNKNVAKFSSVMQELTSKLIRSYFSLYTLGSKGKSNRVNLRFKRLSLNRVIVSDVEIKHTNEKASLTFYVYDKTERYFQFKLENIRSNDVIIRKRDAKKRGVKNVVLAKSKANTNRIILGLKRKKTNLISSINQYLLTRCLKHKTLIMKGLKWGKESFKSYENSYYRTYIKKLHKRQILSLYYAKMLRVNNNKFKNWFLLGIKSILSKIYKKEVEINIVNLKYLHYNSDLLTQAIGIKLKNRNNRLLKVLKKAIRLVRLPHQSLNPQSSKHPLHSFSQAAEQNTINTLSAINCSAAESVLKTMRNKTVNGVRLEAAGRLSRRLTASRSVFKYKYTGSLKDNHSSYKNLSSTLIRGHAKPNVRYTAIDSKTRNGAFGIKGWVSSN